MDDTAKEFDDSEEKVKYDLSSTVMDLDENGHVSKLRNARKGKLAHLTKRKNIMKELMEDATCVQEVKANESKFVHLLDDFKSLHGTYQELLSEEEAIQDEAEWFKPKMADLTLFSLLFLNGYLEYLKLMNLRRLKWPLKTAYLKSPFVGPEQDHFRLHLQV